MICETKLVITGTDRRTIREEVVKAFLSEEPGTGKGEFCSIYLYEVEKIKGGKTLFLKRPGRLNKGFDFEVNVSDMNFGQKRKTSMPSHTNIFDDLKAKKAENPEEFRKLKRLIKRLYNCEQVPCEEMRSLTFKKGHPPEMLLKAIKWLFIEQDVTYWNWSGRDMLYSGVKNCC
jgi:hypothetical protein